MTSVLSCVVAAMALAADPAAQGLPFGIPPAPEDAVIARVAPPQCLLYVNWAGTAAPNASSASETEKLLAEPEIQECFRALSSVCVTLLRKTDEGMQQANAPPAAVSAPPALSLSSPGKAVLGALKQLVPGQTLPSPYYLSDDVQYFPPPAIKARIASEEGDSPRWRVGLRSSSPANNTDSANSSAGSSLAACPAPQQAAANPPPAAAAEKPPLAVSAADYGDFIYSLVTHPTAIFVTDMKQPQAAAPANVEIRAGMVVSLGPDADRLRAKFLKYLKQARKAGADGGLGKIKIAGQTWYYAKPAGPGDKNRVTFGFHGKYFVVGVGRHAVQDILARWYGPPPAWLAKAMEQTPVPRRTGIVYFNLKALRDKLLPLAPSRKDAVAMLEMLGLDNVDSLVSTTGLEDYGMINRVHLALDGKPRGLLDMVADRPLTAKDLEPIPSDALMALAARVDTNRALEALVAAYEQAGGAGDADARKAVEELKTDHVRRFLGSLGDTWCVYNSPTEGEVAFCGWTVVVPVRDRAAFRENWQKLCAMAEEAKPDEKRDGKTDGATHFVAQPTELRKCRFGGEEIYYAAGLPIAPAFHLSDREVVMTLNMPAMKAYLARKDHRSLAALPGVALALGDAHRPMALGYCDTPRLFDFFYPLVSVYASTGAFVAQEANLDLDPTFWPSAPSIRAHLRPDITTLERTPQGVQLTCRYCFPTGGASGPLWLIASGVLGAMANNSAPFSSPPAIAPSSSGECKPATDCGAQPTPASASGGTAAVSSNGSYSTPYNAPAYSGSLSTPPQPAYGSANSYAATPRYPNYGYASPYGALVSSSSGCTYPYYTVPASPNNSYGSSCAPRPRLPTAATRVPTHPPPLPHRRTTPSRCAT